MDSSASHQSNAARDNSSDPATPSRQSMGPRDVLLARLQDELIQQMGAAWRAGSQILAEEWLERHPQIHAQPELAVRIIYEEVCLREENGELINASDIYRRFPQWQDALEVVLDCHQLMQPAAAATVFPKAGEQLGEFRLLLELDRGAVGRVFLATQPALSDRPVVVKFTPCTGDEHLSLARLQHTHIAPLYLVQDFPTHNLRALCMPYLGALSRARLLKALRACPLQQRTGRQIAELLVTAQSGVPVAQSLVRPAVRFLNRATFTQAVCWIGSCLADALHYAHQCGLVHLDIKPSNVLLASDGQPMLLDFHLARPPIPSGSGPVDLVGGTRGYMSHEQALAAAAVQQGSLVSIAVDGRSDIYSLGVLLYESLTDSLPEAEEAASRRLLRQRNRDVSRGLEEVLHKCLARCRQPLSGCRRTGRRLATAPGGFATSWRPNRSPRERWQKWRRRKPHALMLCAAAIVALLVGGGAGSLLLGDRLREARLALAQAHQYRQQGDHMQALQRLDSALDAIRWIPRELELKRVLREARDLTIQTELADTLHELVERLRFLDTFESVPTAKLLEFEAGCSVVWCARTRLAHNLFRSGIDDRLREDLLDLAVLWGDIRRRLASTSDADQIRQEALHVLDEAQESCGPSPILELARRDYCTTLGPWTPLVDLRVVPAPKTMWEHFVIGRFLFRACDLEGAQNEFRRAVDLEPDAFWPNVYLARCAYRLEEFDLALNASMACVALSPKSAECFFNRALCHHALGHREQSFHDFSRALQIDPTLGIVALHRGMLLAEMGRYADATRDLEAALVKGADPTLVYYQMAVVHLAQEDRLASRKSLQQALDQNPVYGPALR